MAPSNRRTFMKASAVATAGAMVVPAVHAGGNDIIKLGLIGVGGRGKGAVGDAFKADKNTKLVAICDIFEDRMASGMKDLKTAFKDRVEVPDNKMFSGFDGYKGVIDSDVDVVLLATSPGFRPLHFAYAIEKNKHVFMEKPHATDAVGIRSVIDTARVATKKNLCVVSGFCYRYDHFKRETVKRIHEGAIGEISSIHTTFNTGELWHRAAKTNDPGDMEYQLRNWYYYSWLSGDFIVEQAIHNVDKACWLMNNEYPTHCTGMGGRQVRTDPKFGNIFDHFSIVYEYAGGQKVYLQCRQMPKCANDNNDYVYGTKGSALLMKHSITSGGQTWTHSGEHDFSQMYVNEHIDLYAALRSGKAINDAEQSAKSTLMGIMGRQAAYTGARLTWKQILESKEDLMPKAFAWGPNPVPAVASPGKTKFV